MCIQQIRNIQVNVLLSFQCLLKIKYEIDYFLKCPNCSCLIPSISTYNYMGSTMNKVLSAFNKGDLTQARTLQVV